VLLTTQNLEEADLLASNIVVIDHGKVIAEGTADQLKAQVGGERLEITVADGFQLTTARELLEPLGVGRATLDGHRRSLVMPVSGGAAVLTDSLRVLDAAQIALEDVGLRRPTLDDVFLSITGHATDQTDSPAFDAQVQEASR
jgi:ABC-2 type transport system ATP-binding protein